VVTVVVLGGVVLVAGTVVEVTTTVVVSEAAVVATVMAAVVVTGAVTAVTGTVDDGVAAVGVDAACPTATNPSNTATGTVIFTHRGHRDHPGGRTPGNRRPNPVPVTFALAPTPTSVRFVLTVCTPWPPKSRLSW